MNSKIHASSFDEVIDKFYPETIKKTRQRIDIFKVLYSASQPLSAAEIFDALNEKGAKETDMPHEGEEFGYVLKGKVKLSIGKKSHVVSEGETFYYKADKKHSLENMLDKQAVVLWISCPPNF